MMRIGKRNPQTANPMHFQESVISSFINLPQILSVFSPVQRIEFNHVIFTEQLPGSFSLIRIYDQDNAFSVGFLHSAQNFRTEKPHSGADDSILHVPRHKSNINADHIPSFSLGTVPRPVPAHIKE